jgi:hypothetical protein
LCNSKASPLFGIVSQETTIETARKQFERDEKPTLLNLIQDYLASLVAVNTLKPISPHEAQTNYN